ncbi:MAG: phytanoyl-CoA dioxygenase family protein [Steroidobacter sp.]
MSFSDTQQTAFAERGSLRLPQAFGQADAQQMVDRIWRQLEVTHRVRPDDAATWTVRQPTGFQSLTRQGIFNPIATPVILAALDDYLGVGEWLSVGGGWGAPLVTFPELDRVWNVPHGQWHLDFPARGPADPLPGIRVLAFIANVEPRGGGTLVISGSNRLVERLVVAGRAEDGRSAEIRESLASAHAWFRGLWCGESEEQDRVQRFMSDSEMVEDVEVRVEELTGAPGDVILMHPWTLHAPAPNCGDAPRFMITHSVFRRPGGDARPSTISQLRPE